jgi:hypothetical protein
MMISDINDEICKGIEYSRNSERIATDGTSLAAVVSVHSVHILEKHDGEWVCDCQTYQDFGCLPGGSWCRHVIALERFLEPQESVVGREPHVLWELPQQVFATAEQKYR